MQYDFLLFTFVCSNLFNYINRGLFNFFVQFFLCTIINLNFVVRIYLAITIIIIFILFFLRNYTGTIDGNVSSVFKIFGALFPIRCTFFKLFMTTINMFSHVSVHVTYFLYIIFVYFHNISHIADIIILCCTRAFMH